MKKTSFSKKRIIHMYIIIFIMVMLILIGLALMFKYSVEGEKKLPFNLKKINIMSTAESKLTQDAEEKWHANIMQKNNIYFVIEKNNKYKKEDAIKKISFENFSIEKENSEMQVNIYRPSSSANDYIYTEEYSIENNLEYTGDLSTNIENLQINNQGGLIGFSIVSNNIGEYIFTENEKIPGDGKVFKLAGIEEENIKLKVSFDIIIETSKGNKFKSKISFDLPTGDIIEDGVGTLEDTTLEGVVFKRIK